MNDTTHRHGTPQNRTRLAIGLAAAALTLLTPAVLSAPAQAACRIDMPCTPAPRPPVPPRPTPTPTPAPTYNPDLNIDVARQTTTLDGVRIAGWTADKDAPTTALTVDILVDGTVVRTVTANGNRPDVGSVFPAYGSAHGFDLTLPVSNADHTISARAHNVGSGSDSSLSKAEDRVKTFAANTLEYDLPHAVIVSTTPEQLNRVDVKNGSSLNQPWELDLSGSTTETNGWTNSQSIDISLSTTVSVGVPVFVNGQVQVKVDGSLHWQQNSQVQVTKTWMFKQTTTVPARTELVASSSISETVLRLPYTMHGSWVWVSGYTEAGTTTGTYEGANAHDMNITLTQTSLDTGSSLTTQQPVTPTVTSSAPRTVSK